jgi:hypothetical protein
MINAHFVEAYKLITMPTRIHTTVNQMNQVHSLTPVSSKTLIYAYISERSLPFSSPDRTCASVVVQSLIFPAAQSTYIRELQ